MIGRAASLIPGFMHHVEVLRASWASRGSHKGSGATSDHDFLPAALENIEKPPSPAARSLLALLCTMFLLALIWALLGTIDVVATAPGKTVPTSQVKTIQPAELGIVRAIHIRNGQHVEEGQLLIELDPTQAAASEDQAKQALATANVVKSRSSALLMWLGGKAEQSASSASNSLPQASVERTLLGATIAEHQAQKASLLQQRAERHAELVSANAEITKLRETLPLVDQQLAARRKLTEQGHFSKLRMLEYEQLRIEHIQNIAAREADALKARAAMAVIDAEVDKLRQTLSRSAAMDLADATDRSLQAVVEVRKSTQRLKHLKLRAPVSGTVQQLSVSTVGGVVQPAEPLMVLVPDASPLQVEASISNKDIGFVREGQPVRIKIDAYPFTQYGIVTGTIENISRDAMIAPRSVSSNAPTDLFYAARISLAQNAIRVGSRYQPLGPGLAVQAEILTGRRKIISYLLSPITRSLDEAGREQ